MRANILVCYQHQYLGQRFGRMRLKADIRSNAVILLLFFHWFVVAPIICEGFMLGPCFMVRVLTSFLVWQLYCRGREGLVVLQLPVLYVFSSRCRVIVCSLRLWQFLFILTF